ncbi:MAG TPA: DinB family protein [Candidatus Saccharimonadales bacterium]|nr:DinB family protein [Candidatus Saccharimonadales bacterium]
MIDFGAVREKRQGLAGLATGFSKRDLANATRAITADIERRIRDARDEDVTFVPVDPAARDEFATDSSAVGLAWTLGHVVVHLTASAEETSFLAAELARGVPAHGRSRHEVPWQTVTTIDACRARLRESERMILATLDSWPEEPHLDVLYVPASGTPRNAVARFLGGLMHADSHLDQLSEIVRQARDARTAASSTARS